MSGQLTLIKAALGSLGSYLMPVFPTLITIIRALELMRARFFCGADLDERRIHFIRWDRVLDSKAMEDWEWVACLLLIQL